ncbi:hypothetical protein ACGFZP_31420 [Kitasatospora sp. NPDC048239]|uniref:hypothetical protein n=1 Tax=Kitasatospora sp. NPDC048239 TaxID=3364046 RepID=UPI003710E7BF
MPHRTSAEPVGLSEHGHRTLLKRCLHDDSLPLDVRAAGALIPLYGQRLSLLVLDEAELRPGGQVVQVEILTRRTRIGGLLGQVRDLESERAQDAVQRNSRPRGAARDGGGGCGAARLVAPITS